MSPALASEVLAAGLGRRLGAEHGHDPSRLAAAIGASVSEYPAAELPGGTAHRMVLGRSLVPARLITIAALQPEASKRRTLAHELGHCLRVDDGLGGGDAESVCDAFAGAFLGVLS